MQEDVWGKVATMKLEIDGRVKIEPLKPDFLQEKEIVYAWKTKDKKWVRIGTSKGKLSTRLNRYEKNISATFDLIGKSHNQSANETDKIISDWEKVNMNSNDDAFLKNLKDYKKYIKTVVFSNKRVPSGSTDFWEALCWKAILLKQKKLYLHALFPKPVDTIVGPLRPYLDIERHLIKDHRPILNRSHH